ncbi:glycosyltransferase [Thermomonas sp. S9]|uniref:glycosyltransferase n=1 Tax=Thermomonas sp. S9 TaxID=2885203 RepID=UPI00216ADC17|nr:glycosyltransferase [Thermomonas sp. S9]MCR6496044.1 glycosyltransferase [Thermomonas sp. S9]
MKKIAILLPDLRGGGAERVMVDLAQEFASLGHSVEFVLMRATGEFLPEAQRDFAIVDLAAPRARNATGALIRYLRRRRPAAVIAAMWPLTAIAPVAARMAGFQGKVLASEHAILSRQYAPYGRFHRLALRVLVALGYRLASARAGVSRGTCADMAALSWMTSDRFATVHNPVRAAVMPCREALNAADALWGAKGTRILTVGSLKPVKNHALLLQAFAVLPRSEARLMLLGQGQDEVALRVLAAELGIADRVIFAGFHLDPSPFYATADLFVLSSDHEGFGNVIVEALSFGLPVVSTDCPSGPAEILQGGRYGHLVPVGDAQALAHAMDEALDTPADRAALIRRAADFKPEIAARKYLELLGLA